MVSAASHWPRGTERMADSDDLGGVPTDIQAERDDRGRKGVERQAERRQAEEDEEQLDQQRRAADERDVEAGEPGQDLDRREPHQGHDQRDDQADREADDGERDGGLDRGEGHRTGRVLDQLPGRAVRAAVVRSFGPGVADGNVTAEVLRRDRGQRAIVAQLGQRVVDGVPQLAVVLAEGENLLAGVAGLGGDLDVGVAGGLEVLQRRQVVVDGGIDALLLDQRDRLGEALDRLDLGARFRGHLGPVAGRALGRRLALQVGQAGRSNCRRSG